MMHALSVLPIKRCVYGWGEGEIEVRKAYPYRRKRPARAWSPTESRASTIRSYPEGIPTCRTGRSTDRNFKRNIRIRKWDIKVALPVE